MSPYYLGIVYDKYTPAVAGQIARDLIALDSYAHNVEIVVVSDKDDADPILRSLGISRVPELNMARLFRVYVVDEMPDVPAHCEDEIVHDFRDTPQPAYLNPDHEDQGYSLPEDGRPIPEGLGLNKPSPSGRQGDYTAVMLFSSSMEKRIESTYGSRMSIKQVTAKKIDQQYLAHMLDTFQQKYRGKVTLDKKGPHLKFVDENGKAPSEESILEFLKSIGYSKYQPKGSLVYKGVVFYTLPDSMFPVLVKRSGRSVLVSPISKQFPDWELIAAKVKRFFGVTLEVSNGLTGEFRVEKGDEDLEDKLEKLIKDLGGKPYSSLKAGKREWRNTKDEFDIAVLDMDDKLKVIFTDWAVYF